MADGEKILERMRQTNNGWTPNDFERMYKAFGFDVEEGGNHTTYRHAEHVLITQVPRHKPLKPYLARAAVSLIDKLKALEREKEDENER